MKFKLTLSRKGMVLIAIPFFVQLVFFLSYSKMLDQSESLSWRQYGTQALLARENRLIAAVCAASISCFEYILSKETQSYDDYRRAMKYATHEPDLLLRECSKEDSQTIAGIHKVVDLTNSIVAKLDPVPSIYSKQGQDAALDVFRDRELRWNFVRLIRRGTENALFSTPEFENAPGTTSSLKSLFALGIVINVIMAFGSMALFSASLTHRLNILTDNSNRLATGKPLNPPVTGDDELAILDRTFHSMADALEQARRKERAVVANMLVGLVSTDTTGIIESINPRVEKIFGFTGQEILGRNITILFPDTVKDVPVTFEDYILKNSLGEIGELEGRRWHGDLFPIEVSVSQFESQDGMHYLAHILDVSDKYEIERMKRDFVATVTHELRTPLTSIRGSLSLLKAEAFGQLPAQMKNVVAIAERNTIRLIGLINDILDIEKLSAGKLEMHFSYVPLSVIIERTLESVKSFAEQYEVKIETTPTNLKAYADNDRIVQVLVNLVSNAVKFSPKDGVVTIVQIETDEWVEVQVTDQGIGIPKAKIGLLFQRFNQIKSADKRHQGGTGLGLAISKSIIEQHGGNIGVDSEEGKGSTFWFTVPRFEGVKPIGEIKPG